MKNVTEDEPEIVTLKFSRVVFGVSLSPFLLNATLQHHVNKYDPLWWGSYSSLPMLMTYVVGGADTEEQAHQFYKGSKQLLAAGSFNLRKFVSNLPSPQVKVEREEPPSGSTPLPTDGAEPLDETYAEASLATRPFNMESTSS